MAPTNDLIKSFDLVSLILEPATKGLELKPNPGKEPGEKFYTTTTTLQYLAGVEEVVPDNQSVTQKLTSNYFSGIDTSVYLMETDQYKKDINNTKDSSTIVAKAPEPAYRTTTSQPQKVEMNYCCDK